MSDLVVIHHRFFQIIILEDDLEIADDFFSFMLGSLPVLKADDQLFCVVGIGLLTFND